MAFKAGKGVRGCTPFEYQTLYANVVYIRCKVCGFAWNMDLTEYKTTPPERCPLCGEVSLSAFWKEDDAQPYEYFYIPGLKSLELLIKVPDPNEQGIEYGDPGLYEVIGYPSGTDLAIFDSTSLAELDLEPQILDSIEVPSGKPAASTWLIEHNLNITQENGEWLRITTMGLNRVQFPGHWIEGVTDLSDNMVKIKFILVTEGYCFCEKVIGGRDIPPPQPIFSRLVEMTHPDYIQNGEMYHREMLKCVITDPRLEWKKAVIHSEDIG